MRKNLIYKLFFTVIGLLLYTAVSGFCEESGTQAMEKNKKVLYLFAHQDDELGTIGKMATDVKAGNEVFAVWITDGALSGPPDVREKESRSVMKMIGVPQKNLFFLGYPDMDSYEHLSEVYRDVLKTAEDIEPIEITSNAYEGGNIDHDTSNFIGAQVAKILKTGPVHYEFPTYNMHKGNYQVGKFLPRNDSKTLYIPLNDESINLKLKALEMYPSQAELLNVLKALVSRSALRRYGEPYRVTPKYDYTQRPIEEPLGYEVATRMPRKFESWREAIKGFFSDNPSDSPNQLK